jgi:ABC-2 type transport system ATP-binding protein
MEIPTRTSHEPAHDFVIETVALTRRFDDLVAVDHVDLGVRSGTIFGLLGPNGAGKTTKIKILTTLLPPTSGSARVAGFDVVKDARRVRQHIGYVPQMLSADGALTAYENLLLSARLYGIRASERQHRIGAALQFMGLTSAAHERVQKYSGGMIRRLELAQALLHRPGVLFLDEPTVGLDPVARRAVWERLLELKRLGSTTILMTTHDMEEAEVLCDELALMHQGWLAARGSPNDLKRDLGPEATLEDVFARYAEGTMEEGGNYRDVRRTRSTARRLG